MVLERIVEHKRTEVAERKTRVPLARIRDGLAPSDRSLFKALKKQRTGFILECKKASPSRGLIRPDFDPGRIAESYQPYADAISVLIDNHFFKGRLEYLQAVREAVSVPVLAKDFILEPYQVYEARKFSADAILLMLSVLDDQTLKACWEVAESLKMDVLAEVHDEDELKRAIDLELPIIGINNRNLKTLDVDLTVTENLAPKAPRDRILVAESGVSTHGDVVRLRPHVDGFLVGTSLMSQSNIDGACKKLIYGPVKVCGLTRPEDATSAARAGALFGGLIFAPQSPRNVDVAQAKQIIKACQLQWVGVFVNESPKRIVKLAEELDLFAVQLHGDETPDYISKLKELLSPDRKIWKAIRVGSQMPPIDVLGADRVLLDTFHKKKRGGTGETFNWSLLKECDLKTVILSGGLNPENAREADLVGACCLDVNSGVEEAPGVKDRALLLKFFSTLQSKGRIGDTHEK